MLKYILVLQVMIACSSLLQGQETLHLGKDQNWQPVPADERGRFLIEVAKAKQLVTSGKEKEATQALAKLKQDFPAIAGPDVNAFIAADLLYAKGKFTKAIPLFENFLNEYPTSPLYDAGIERIFQMGTALLAGYKVPLLKIFRVKGFEEGVKTMEKLADRTGDAPIAQQALIAVAHHYEKRKKFREAYDTWADIASRWPTGELGKTALLSMARDLHSGYKGPRYDASGLASAKGYFQTYKLRYPESAAELKIDDVIKEIEEQLSYKQYNIGKYYQRTGSKTASNIYYTSVEDMWPGTIGAKMAQQSSKTK